MTNLKRLMPDVRLPISLAALLCIFTANTARADAIYNFSLPQNGSVSALSVTLQFPNLLPAGGLLIIPVTAPPVTSLSFTTPGFITAGSVIGLQVTPTTTLIGVGMNSSGGLLLFTPAFPGDFFSFTRAPETLGAFPSTSGNVVSILQLADSSPEASLTVASVPEPSAFLLMVSALVIAGLRRCR